MGAGTALIGLHKNVAKINENALPPRPLSVKAHFFDRGRMGVLVRSAHLTLALSFARAWCAALTRGCTVGAGESRGWVAICIMSRSRTFNLI